MTACLLVGTMVFALAVPTFTLRWTHSVERTVWAEEWKIDGQALHLMTARVKGSGAGMEPGADARLEDGWWVWSPGTTVPELHLAASGATGAGWEFCADGQCQSLGVTASAPLLIAPCP